MLCDLKAYVGSDHHFALLAISAYQWTYDADNRVTQEKSAADATSGNDWGITNYSYDSTGELLGASYTTFADAPTTDGSYQYDANGNRVGTIDGTTYSVGGNNEMTSGNGYAYEYDHQGNVIAQWVQTTANAGDTAPASGDTSITTYQWDNRNRLTEVETFANYSDFSAGTPVPSQVVTYSYDAYNRWIGETVTTYSDGSATGTTKQAFIYDGNQIVLQFNGTSGGSLTASNLSDRYLWAPAVDQLLAQEAVSGQTSAGSVLWALTDNQNTVRDLASYNSSSSATTIAQHRIYDAFGALTSPTPSASAADCVFGYTGRPFDSSTGLQNNLNRWYNPSIGRWLSQDPIGFAGGDLNLYRYCANAPINESDPRGTDTAPPRALDPNVKYKLSIIKHAVGTKTLFGGFSARIDWSISPPAPAIDGITSNKNFQAGMDNHTTGDWPVATWVVQTLHVTFDVKKCGGGVFQDPRDDDNWNYVEAWWIPPGLTTQGVAGNVYSDTYSLPKGTACTYGTVVFTGSAQLYTNITLPGAFSAKNDSTHAHSLPATTSMDAMAGITPATAAPVAHVVTVKWTLGGATTVSF